MLLFITNPVLIAAYLMCVTTYSFALTDCPSVNTVSAYAVHCLVLLQIASRFYSIKFFNQDIRNSNTTKICVCVCVCMYVYMYICVCVCVCVCVCIYIYIYIYTDVELNFLYFRWFKNIMGMNCLEIIKFLEFKNPSGMCFVRLHNHWGEKRLYPSLEGAFSVFSWYYKQWKLEGHRRFSECATGWTIQCLNHSWDMRFYLLQNIQIGSEAHPASCSVSRRTLSLGIKWPGCEPDHSSPSSAEDKNVCGDASTPPLCIYCMYRDHLTFLWPL